MTESEISVDATSARPTSGSMKRKTAVSLIVILLATFLAYLPNVSNNFIYLDDDSHLLENSAIRVLDGDHIKRIFTTTVDRVYVPLTFLSFAIEHHFFGYQPFIYHFDNILLHLGVTALVFAFALQLGLPLRAAIVVGALFGLHPMHVESVAWVTERKDVLYALFYMAALSFYWRYLQSKNIFFYAAAIVFGVMSMLSKPMALSLPLILLACDWFYKRKWDPWMLIDKIPHFIYAVSIAWVTYSLNSRIPGENLSSGALIWVWTAVFYIHKFFVPAVLVPMYALPEPIAVTNGHYAGAVALFFLIAGVVIRWRKNRFLIFAVLYYVLSMFFLFRYDNAVDKSIVADRFIYLACLGICLFVGQSAEVILAKAERKKKILANILIGFLVAAGVGFFLRTYAQTKVWRESISFWSYVIEYYPQNAMAYGNRGEAYNDIGQYEKAMADFNEAIARDPNYIEAYNSRGQMYGKLGEHDLALADFQKVIEAKPRFDEAYNNIGIIYLIKEEYDAAAEHFQKAIDIDPYNSDAHYNLGDYYYNKGGFDLAFEHFQKVLEIDPAAAAAYNKRGLIYGIQGDFGLALADIDRAITFDPKNSDLYKNKGIILEHQKEFDQAILSYTKAIELNPLSADAYCFRGNTYAQSRRYGEAAKDFGKALEIDENHWRAKQSQQALIKILVGDTMSSPPPMEGEIPSENPSGEEK